MPYRPSSIYVPPSLPRQGAGSDERQIVTVEARALGWAIEASVRYSIVPILSQLDCDAGSLAHVERRPDVLGFDCRSAVGRGRNHRRRSIVSFVPSRELARAILRLRPSCFLIDELTGHCWEPTLRATGCLRARAAFARRGGAALERPPLRALAGALRSLYLR